MGSNLVSLTVAERARELRLQTKKDQISQGNLNEKKVLAFYFRQQFDFTDYFLMNFLYDKFFKNRIQSKKGFYLRTIKKQNMNMKHEQK